MFILLLAALAAPAVGQGSIAEWVSVQTEDAKPTGTIVYSRTFELDFEPEQAWLKYTVYTSADFAGTTYRSFVNNIQGPGGTFWMDTQYTALPGVLHKGTNAVEIEVAWVKNGVPGPMLMRLYAKGRDEDGAEKTIDIRSDSSWTYRQGEHRPLPADEPKPAGKPVAVVAAADKWEPARSPQVLPKISTSKVVGVTDVVMKGGNAGSLFQFDLVRDYSDKYYFLRQLGYASIEDYVFGQTNYQYPGEWFWGYDKQLAQNLERADFDFTVYPWVWVPAEWYRKQELLPMVRCIEHGEEGFGLSLWSPLLAQFNNDVYRELRENFGDRIEFIYPGIYGDFGEAHYMAGWNPWMNPKPEHQHAGFWAGDDLARADFREKMLSRYTTVNALNAAWGTAFSKPEDIAYPKLDGSDPRRYALDFVNWYYDSMTEFTAEVCATVREHFPETSAAPKLGCGDENPMWGQDNSAIPEALAAMGIGIRSTHGSSGHLYVRRISSACKFYGNSFETETASGANRSDALKKFFIDASSGCGEVFEYPNAILGVADIFSNNRRWLRGEHSITEIALFFPTSWHRARLREGYPPRLAEVAEEIRDVLDFDVVDENMVLDGALKNYRVLAMLDGDFTEKAVYDALMAWVENGGTLVMIEDQLPYATVEGEVLPVSELADQDGQGGAAQAFGTGQVLVWGGEWSDRDDLYSLMHESAFPPSSSPTGLGGIDGRADGVWTSLFNDYVLYLNDSDAPVVVVDYIPEDFARRVGLDYSPSHLYYQMEIPARSQAVRFLDRRFAESALECEDMPEAETMTTQVIYKGGSGDLGECVRIPEGQSVGLTFEVTEPGSYGFACLVDPVHLGRGQLEIDGKVVANLSGPVSYHRFMYPVSARVDLGPGRHTLRVLSVEGEILADKVMVTTDTGLEGFTYGFVDPGADSAW